MHRATRTLPIALVAALLAACGNSSGPTPGFECLGQALPTTAPPLVNVSGMVTANVLSPTPVPHAFVYAFRTGDTTHLAGDTTNTPGQYSVDIATGGTPVNGYLAISDSGHHIDTYAYPAVPLAANVTDNVLMVSGNEFSLLAASAGITPMAGDGFIGVIVRNCQGAPVAGRDRDEQPGWYRALQCRWIAELDGDIHSHGRRRVYRERRPGQRDRAGDGERPCPARARGQRARGRDHADANSAVTTISGHPSTTGPRAKSPYISRTRNPARASRWRSSAARYQRISNAWM